MRLPKNWSSLAKGERKETAIGKYLYYFFCTVFSKTNAVYILDKNLSHWQLFGNCYKFYTIQTKWKFTFFDRQLCNCKAKEKRSFQPTTLPSERKLDLTGFTSYGTHKDTKNFVEYISKGCWQLCWVTRLDSVICASPESSSWIWLLNIFHWTDHSLTQFVHPTKNKQVEQLFCTYGFLRQRRLFCRRNSLLNKISPLL